ATAGEYTAHATDFIYKGSKSQAAAFPDEIKAGQGNLELFQHYASRHAYKMADYRVEDALGRVFTGKLDSEGFASVAGLTVGPAKVTLGNDPTDTWSPASEIKDPNENAANPGAVHLTTQAAQQVATAILANAAVPNSPSIEGLFKEALENPSAEEVKHLVISALGKARS
ncbi:hypothetical protein EGJ51_23430, partial [Pseudomonas fulva]